MNVGAVCRLLGSACLLLAGALVLPAAVGLAFGEKEAWQAFVIAALASAALGGALVYTHRGALRTTDGRPAVFRREGLVVVACAWTLAGVIGAVPFLLCGATSSFSDAFFESSSGFTTTGASIFSGGEIDRLPRAINFWRCLTHWIGGIGIVVVFVAILPAGGRSLYRSEGLSREESESRVRDIARSLLRVYALLTLALTMLLLAAGMDAFDAVLHAFSTMATGGFSTRGDSIAYYGSSVVELVLIVFMIVAGTNFAVWNNFLRHGLRTGLREALGSSELRLFLALMAGATLVMTLVLWFWGGSNGQPGSDLPDYASLRRCLRDAAFSLVSIQTCTGFATADFERWPDGCRVILMAAAFFGACSGSTGGGVKIARLLIVVRASLATVRAYARPRAITVVPLDRLTLSEPAIAATVRFFALWVLVALGGVLLLALLGMDATSAISGVISCMSNCGPGLGSIGPAANYGHLNDASKLVLSLLMLGGRLELYAFVALALPGFWKR
jgi:trk system potassium uptake protein TrkH